MNQPFRSGIKIWVRTVLKTQVWKILGSDTENIFKKSEVTVQNLIGKVDVILVAQKHGTCL